MKYSMRPSYLAIERAGQPWIAFYILADLAYFSSLLGGIFGAVFWIVWPTFRILKGQSPHWIFIFVCLLTHVVISVAIFNISKWGARRLFARFDLTEY